MALLDDAIPEYEFCGVLLLATIITFTPMLSNSTTEGDVTLEFISSLPQLNLSFTTPFLDFEEHSGRLGEIINLLYDFNRDKLQTSLLKSESRQPIIVRLCFEVLMRFNTLTRPPQKKSSRFLTYMNMI